MLARILCLAVCLIGTLLWVALDYSTESKLRHQVRSLAHLFRPRQSSKWLRIVVRTIAIALVIKGAIAVVLTGGR